MAYAKNILPKSAAYYTLNKAAIEGSNLILEANGYAEISVSHQMLSKLTSKMLVVVHPSIFSDYYTNDAVQVNLSVILSDGTYLDYLVSASQTSSGVFNAELDFPEGDFINFTYRISSAVPVTVYNWELCNQEAVDLTTVIEGVEQELPKLLYDYNTYAYAVAQKELTVGLITCYLLDNTSLQGHFTLSFFATERCNVHVRIKDNGVTELFSPQVYTVEKGYASISIPHAYLNKLATAHAFAVTIQCTNGQLSIPVRGLLYTIDGGYLATRLLDAGIDIEDISIRQITSDIEPSEIWAIGFEGNRMLLKKRTYDTAQSDTWYAIKDFGEAKHAAVEFRGHWISRGREEKYTIETENTPYVFIVDTNNNLLVYSGDTYENVITLDTNVDSIFACQGFNSVKYEDQDQGLIITYIKEGNAYYRQLLYSLDVWQAIIPIYEIGDASCVSVHRLPDYRIGICVEHSTGTKWYISTRTYVNQAIKPELIDAGTNGCAIATVYDVNKAPDALLVAGTKNTLPEQLMHNGFILTFEHPVKLLCNKTISDLMKVMTASIGDTYLEIADVKIINNRIEIYLANEVRGGQNLTIKFNFFFIATTTYNGCNAAIQQEYTWYLPMNTLRSNNLEDIGINMTASMNAVVTPIVTSRLTQINQINTSISTTMHAEVIPIITNRITVSDNIDISASAKMQAEVILVGTSPI